MGHRIHQETFCGNGIQSIWGGIGHGGLAVLKPELLASELERTMEELLEGIEA